MNKNVIAIGLVALIVGGGVYWWQNSIVQKTIIESQKQVNDLKNQVNAVESEKQINDLKNSAGARFKTGSSCPWGLRAGVCNEYSNQF